MYRFFSRFFLPLVLLFGMSGLFGSGLRAQGAYGLKRAEFDVHVGPSIPIGSFGKAAFSGYSQSDDKNLPYHGAKVGVDYGLSFGYYISPNWGVMLLFNGHSNKMKVDVPFSFHRLDWNWQTEKVDKWTEFMAMAGATYRASLTDWLVISLRAHIGYAHLISPFYRAMVQRQNQDYTFKINSAAGHSFGYGAGAALKFIVAPGFHLDVRCDYLGTAPFRFKNVGWECSSYNTITEQTVSVTSGSRQIKESFQVINVNFGFTAAF
ncbi:MAG: outer membrane beta-barrel protein [Bacteroidales bacterium]|nr:outer membrane beta-barrel protein [Bacteroidales bacterium]